MTEKLLTGMYRIKPNKQLQNKTGLLTMSIELISFRCVVAQCRVLDFEIEGWLVGTKQRHYVVACGFQQATKADDFVVIAS